MSDLGCALSSVIACLWCASGCSSQRVGANFAFFPPDPPTYSIRYTASPPSPLSLSAEYLSFLRRVLYPTPPAV
jgi:hypothetical protein